MYNYNVISICLRTSKNKNLADSSESESMNTKTDDSRSCVLFHKFVIIKNAKSNIASMYNDFRVVEK